MTHDKTKVNISVMLEDGPPEIDRGPGRYQTKPHPLELKIEEAISRIEADHCKEGAIRFLRMIFEKLESVQRPTRKCQAMLELVQAALADYGHYHHGGEETPDA